jgi:hypothetical protein
VLDHGVHVIAIDRSEELLQYFGCGAHGLYSKPTSTRKSVERQFV